VSSTKHRIAELEAKEQVYLYALDRTDELFQLEPEGKAAQEGELEESKGCKRIEHNGDSELLLELQEARRQLEICRSLLTRLLTT
jgi:hypothetical protein